MDNQDKIFDKFKEAAQNSEQKDFPGMEKVWSRVEDKLDKKEAKNKISLWKKVAIAASLLLLISLGSQFLKSNKTTVIPAAEVVVNEKEKEAIKNPSSEKDNALVSTDSPILPKAEAEKVLDKQIKEQQKVAISEVQGSFSESTGKNGVNAVIIADEVAAPVSVQSGYVDNEEQQTTLSKAKEAKSFGYSRPIQRESAKAAYSEAPQMAKKSAPLIVVDGNALTHSNDEKRERMLEKELPNLKPENVDSLIVLDSPLYIIDGIYYSENDLFGPNPTSPYAPLNKQEIKTIMVLQDLEATSKYGEKGKKGVVIITTRKGKPASQN
ncbi:hypothetical protein IR010_13530 [Flavobacterium sp. MR2016-29]|uniref:hypothetical protein n=1 Tax=Flavobacterium sp. MR2016-29 TaxID=2783795 RepID=UPI00188B64C4|nr:hypothetical protein [Flavobacterium sp. MR2016-29]MBF4493564.1 hypothetical protein [Flavobacterium sp. MR2016-29]